MNKVVKFILRMAVTACIVVGLVAVVMNFTNKNKSATLVADTSASFNLNTKLADSHQNLELIVQQNNTNEFENKANQNVVKAVVYVNDILEKYFDYYITLTCFENAEDTNLKNAIVEKLGSLNIQANQSVEYLNKVNSASSTNYVEKNARIIYLLNSLCNQAEVLSQTCTLLKQYVYNVNYKTDVCTSKTEAVLEMSKDYASVVLEMSKDYAEAILEIVKNQSNNQDLLTKATNNATKVTNIVADTSNTGFVVVAQKTLNMSAESGSQAEIDFAYTYTKINKSFLNTFYASSASGKAAYVASPDNFMGTVPEGETAEQFAARTQKYMGYLLTYLSTSF